MKRTKLVIAGGTGLIGQALAKHAIELDWDVVILARRHTQSAAGRVVIWNGHSPAEWCNELSDATMVVNLCGASIGDGRWTDKRKDEIRDSRILPTRCLVEALEQSEHSPKLLQASAVGFYGIGDQTVDETANPGDDYLSSLAVEWEAEANSYAGPKILARFGVVLDAQAGALPRMLMPFKLFIGGPLGTGRQWFSWVTMNDAVRAIVHALTSDISGPINIVAPNPVTNQELTSAIGQCLHRPSLLPAPGFVLRTLLGEQATLVLDGQNVIPKVLSETGFRFDHPDIDSALSSILNR